MAVRVIVVGAGVAGLCAAVALRQAGHSVKVFEKSQFSTEIGAALSCAPNGTLVLQRLGFDFDRAKSVPLATWEISDGRSLKQLQIQDISQENGKLAAPYYAIHHVDLQQALLNLATQQPTNGPIASTASTLDLRLGCKIVSIDAKDGVIHLEDGPSESADLIVGADGVHSVVRQIVGEQSARATGISAFRFLIPSERLKTSVPASRMLATKTPGVTVFVDTKDVSQDRSIVWYTCRGGELHNFVGTHPTRPKNEGADDLQELLHEFKRFHPDLLSMLSLGEHVSDWSLLDHKPFSTWTKGKAVLIGDAAHPMLPFGGQAGNQAIEDGGTLGVFMQDIQDTAEISTRLKWFEQFRQRRASRVQLLSSVRSGNEHKVAEELRPYLEPGVDLPDTLAKRIIHDANYDAIEEAEKALRIQLQSIR